MRSYNADPAIPGRRELSVGMHRHFGWATNVCNVEVLDLRRHLLDHHSDRDHGSYLSRRLVTSYEGEGAF